jgi:predicted small lipoprotein YifL
MRTGQKAGFSVCFMLCFVLLISITACGRRGDPVAVLPYEKEVVEKETDEVKGDQRSSKSPAVHKEVTETGETELTVPDSPAGLSALYTQKGIILVWDEVHGREIRFYRIYRSSGDEYRLVGDSIAPVFHDSDVKPGMRYFYRVTAVGGLEGLPSEEIDILTEVH